MLNFWKSPSPPSSHTQKGHADLGKRLLVTLLPRQIPLSPSFPEKEQAYLEKACLVTLLPCHHPQPQLEDGYGGAHLAREVQTRACHILQARLICEAINRL